MSTEAGLVIMPLMRGFALFCCSLIFYKEYRKRKEIKIANDTNPANNVYQKLLSIWSMATLITPILYCSIVLIGRIPTSITCNINRFGHTMNTWSAFFLTFYQIARLEYCFLDKQVHSKKYGYPKWMFYALYFIGCMLAIYFAITPWLFYHYAMGADSHHCELTVSEDLELFHWIGTIVYLLWDLCTLLLYIIKIIQIRNKKNNDSDTTSIIMSKITIILKKIVFLTILYEGWSVCNAVILTLFQNSIIQWIFPAFDPIMTSLIIYLMIEHNNDKYVELLRVLHKMRICFCCNCLTKDGVITTKDEQQISKTLDGKQAGDDENENKNKTIHEDTEYETHNISNDQCVEIEVQSTKSELSMTAVK